MSVADRRLTDVWSRDSGVNVNIANTNVEIGRTSLTRIKSTQDNSAVSHVTCGFKSWKVDSICKAISERIEM